MDVNLIKHRLKKFVIFIGLYKEKEKIFTKDIFRSKKYIIGEYTYGEPNVYFDNEANLFIGKFCSLSQNIKIFLGGNHRMDWITTYPFNALNEEFPEARKIIGHPSTKGDVIIGNDVWIGYGVFILSGVTIGNGAVIGANSVVSKNIGAYEVWAGNPAKFIKKRFDDVTINNFENIQWWNWDIDKIIKNVEILCSTNTNLLKNK